MSKRAAYFRKLAAARQGNRCYYCNRTMTNASGPDPLLCTAEHLLPKSEGGRDTRGNVVAACAFCNRTRHRARRPMPPDLYKAYVRKRIQKGRWLAKQAPPSALARADSSQSAFRTFRR